MHQLFVEGSDSRRFQLTDVTAAQRGVTSQGCQAAPGASSQVSALAGRPSAMSVSASSQVSGTPDWLRWWAYREYQVMLIFAASRPTS